MGMALFERGVVDDIHDFLFQSLTTTVSETSLRVHFGPIPLLEKGFAGRDCFRSEKTACSMAGGALDPGQRLDFNVWGFDCLAIWVQDISEWEPTTRTSSAKSWKEPYRHSSRKPWTDR